MEEKIFYFKELKRENTRQTFKIKNGAHIYLSGGYTKLRGINWQRLKEQGHRLGLHDELLDSV